METVHILPDSGTADVVTLATTTNVDAEGVWAFRVDSPTVSAACGDDGSE